VKRSLDGGFELDDDPGRIDVEAVHRFLAEDSYWARGRSLTDMQQLLAEAARVIGLYREGAQVGFCRAARCTPALYYLADVYVLPGHRGRGLGTQLVREMVERGPLARSSWILHTLDAHELYRKLGFEEPSSRVLERRAPAGKEDAPPLEPL